MKIIYFLLAIWLLVFTLEAQAEPLYLNGVQMAGDNTYVIMVPTCSSAKKKLIGWQLRVSGGNARISNIMADYNNAQTETFVVNKIITAGQSTDWYTLNNCPWRIRVRAASEFTKTSFAELWGQFQ